MIKKIFELIAADVILVKIKLEKFRVQGCRNWFIIWVMLTPDMR